MAPESKVRPGPMSHIEHGEYSKASRALALGSYFISGCMAINASQFLGIPLYLINEDWYNAWIAFTKQSWGLLTTSMTQCWAPTIVRVSGHKSIRGELLRTTDGNLLSNFPERLVLIANHQIYTDWLYLWWMGYTNGMHGRIYVVLKESLRRIPIIGWGMQFSQFIFLKRNWETDKDRLATHMQKLNDPSTPMWLMIFPEGTNLHPVTRKASQKWADKNKIPDMRHQLLPRSRGLQFCIQQLRQTVRYVYDCTIAYEGVSEGQYASEIFTIQAAYFGGTPPKSVNMYWRRFDVSSIPVDNDKAFDNWLRARWIEKDQLLQYYQKTGHFPADKGVSKLTDGRIVRGAGYIETEIKPNRWYEYLQIFAPVGLLALILYMFYGALPRRIVKDIDQQVLQETKQERPQDWEHMMDSMPRIVELASTRAGSVISDHPPSHTDVTTADVPVPKEKAPHKKTPLKKTPPRKLNANKGATTTPKKPLQPGVKPKKLTAGSHAKPVHVQEKPKVIKPQIPALPKQPQPQTTRAPQAKLSTTAPAKKKLGAKPASRPRPPKQPSAAALPPASGPRNEKAIMESGPAHKKLETKPNATARGKGVRAPPRKLEIRSR